MLGYGETLDDGRVILGKESVSSGEAARNGGML